MEKWKGLIYQGKDYSAFYEISNDGRIRNAKTQRVVKLNKNPYGYYIYVGSLGKRGRQKAFKVHKCVAEAFISNPNGYPVVNHIDGDKCNNNVSNLEWCTQDYNMYHAAHVLKAFTGKRNHSSKGVLALDKSGREVLRYESVNQAAEELASVKHQHINWVARSIYRVLNGERRTYNGLVWRYA